MTTDNIPSTEENRENEELTVSLVTPGTHSIEINQFNQLIRENLPLSPVVGAETYSTKNIHLDDIEGLDSREVGNTLTSNHIHESKDSIVVTDEYLTYTRGVKFDGKQIFVRKGTSYEILKPDLSHIRDVKEAKKHCVYEKSPDGKKRMKVYRYKDGRPILQEDGRPIPIFRSKKLEYSLVVGQRKGEIENMRRYFQIYLDNPERISYDGHSVEKHSFDSMVALKILMGDKYIDSSYYKIEQEERREEDMQKPLQYKFVLSTNEIITLPGKLQAEKLVHVEVAREMANALKERINSESKKECNRIGRNVISWIKEFASDEPLLGILLYNEIKYMLKYDYNLDYNTERKFLITDIEDILPDDGVKDIDSDNTVPNNIIEKIRNTFKYEKVGQKDSNLEELLPLESKVDDVLEYLEKEGIGKDSNIIEYLRLSGGFNRTIRPVVVLNSRRINEREILPTTSITTSYLKEYYYNQFIGEFGKYAVSKSMQDTILQSAREGREVLDDMLMGVGEDRDEVKNLNILDGRWIDRLADQFPKALNIDKDTIERFALVAKS